LITIGIECESIEDRSWGVGKLLQKLLEELAKNKELEGKFRFYLYFKKQIPDYPFLKNAIFTTRVSNTPSFSVYYYIWLPIRQLFDHIHVMFYPNYMLPLLHVGTSMVMLTDDIHYEMRNPQLPFRYRLAYWIFGNWAARRATRIMAISESSKKELVRLFGIDSRRIFVNHLGVDLQTELRGENKELKINNKPLILNSNPFILCVGQMFPRRHAREVMLAFENIAPLFSDTNLLMIGTDKYNPPRVRNLANAINGRLQSQRILWKEYVPQEELNQLYADAQAVVYVSDREAFGLPPIEALAHGSVPIVADTPVSHEIFGNHAFFVAQPITTELIAEAMHDALTPSPQQNEILSARRDILKKFTWNMFAQRFLVQIQYLCSK